MGPTIKILKAHPNDEEVPQGEEGEVCVQGPCVTAGYLVRSSYFFPRPLRFQFPRSSDSTKSLHPSHPPTSPLPLRRCVRT